MHAEFNNKVSGPLKMYGNNRGRARIVLRDQDRTLYAYLTISKTGIENLYGKPFHFSHT